MSRLHFLQPQALLLVPLALAAYAVWRRRLGGALTLAVLLCFAVAIALPQWATQTHRVARLYLLDVSGSTFLDVPKALAAVRGSMAELHAADRVGLIVFGASPAVALPLTSPRAVPDPLALPAELPNADATDIAAAIHLAVQQLADPSYDRQLVLLTDGRSTAGGAEVEAALAADAGVRLFALPLGPADVADARVSLVRAPAQVRVGEAFDLEIVVVATAALDATLSLLRDGSPLAPPRAVAAEPGVPRRIVVSDRLDKPGAHTYAASLDVADRCTENNSSQAVVRAEGATRVVCLAQGETPLTRLLAPLPGIEVAQARPRDLAALPGPLATADCVVLDGVPASDLEARAQQAIRDWVRDTGGGLVALGGPNSYGPGGYDGSAIEEALPVLCSRPHKIALIVALDRSGSMADRAGDRSKISFAREAVARSAGRLRESDSFALLAFAGQADVVVPLGPPPAPERLLAKLDAIAPHGPTELEAALQQALRLAKPSPAQVRHVILVSDGQVTDAQAARIRQLDLRKTYADAGVTLSALMTGRDDQAAALLKELAGASFHLVENPADLPAVFLDELRKATYGELIREGASAVRPAGPADVTRGIAPGRLGGYVRTVPKVTAAAEWLTGDPPDPILARWQFGLGRALAFASTVGTRWDEGFLPPEAVGRLWQQAIRWAARPPRTPGFEGQLAQQGDTVLLTVRAERDERYLNGLHLIARLAALGAAPHETPLRQTAPGEYQAALPAPARGAYHVTVFERGGGQRLSLSAVRNYSAEWEAFGVDPAALDALARNGLGSTLAGLDGLRSVPPRAAAGRLDIDWLFLAAGLALFIAEVALLVVRSRRLRM